ncbi:MAG: Gp49 family protein [Aeromonas veronii]
MDIEKEIKDARLNATRVTPQRIEDVIIAEAYFTASDAATATGEPYHDSMALLTFCVIVLNNGFTVTGESACDSPENFNAEIGRKVARDNAVNKIWMLEGYLLKQKLSEI